MDANVEYTFGFPGTKLQARHNMSLARRSARFWVFLFVMTGAVHATAQEPHLPLRVFIFAGQSNMVGSDSYAKDIERFPPFAGLEKPQGNVRFSYCIGREVKLRSDGWVDLQPVNDVVGPEPGFARAVCETIDGPIAIIKCAAGGTDLGNDWNPDEPGGFEMYPLLLDLIRSSLQDLERQNIPWIVALGKLLAEVYLEQQ